MTRSKWTGLMLVVGLLWAAGGCGDDTSGDSTGSDPEEPVGEMCFSPGAGANCFCEDGVKGTRRCQDDGIWGECSCNPLPDSEDCMEGTKWMCDPCPGQADPRTMTCGSSGVIDCTCPDAGM